jgi:hypothetical protein
VSDDAWSSACRRKSTPALNKVYLGMRVVLVEKIVGSVNRYGDFDRTFLPARASLETKWKSIDRAYHRSVELPPVSLYKIGEKYFVVDGNHRVSVARYRKDKGKDKDGLIESPKKGGERRMREMMSLELAKHRREEVLREAERNRLVKALRAARKRRASRRSVLVWEVRRIAGRLLKLLRFLK